jgi:hypothetical protein
MESLVRNCPEFVSGMIVECEYDEVADTFKPIKLRLDKSHPNSLMTINKTMCNIKENITMDELIKLMN